MQTIHGVNLLKVTGGYRAQIIVNDDGTVDVRTCVDPRR